MLLNLWEKLISNKEHSLHLSKFRDPHLEPFLIKTKSIWPVDTQGQNTLTHLSLFKILLSSTILKIINGKSLLQDQLRPMAIKFWPTKVISTPLVALLSLLTTNRSGSPFLKLIAILLKIINGKLLLT